MRKRRLNAKQWLLFGIMLVLPIAFQNCGSGGFLQLDGAGSSEFSSRDGFFEYPYSAKPGHFVNAQVAGDPAAIKFSNFSVFVALTSASGALENVPYQIKIMDSLRAPVCPDSNGTFGPGASSVSFNCTPASVPSGLIVELTYNPPGQAAKTLAWMY